MPATVPINLPGREYDVLIGENLLAEAAGQIEKLGFGGRRCALVTESTVGELYAAPLIDQLEKAGHQVTPVTIRPGEASKSMADAEDICRQMIQGGLDRNAFLVALGGGVIGDLGGFAASIFYRGIPFVQVPTTIVSQVDSSVGGKTGVNTPEGKNLLGAFHQPSLVLADTATLASLSEREYNGGFAEVIKHAAIRDASMVPLIESAAGNRENLAPLIERNVSIKARIVEEDEKETAGTRALLNFGHTIGHAIESAAGYGNLLHGEAISLGMHAALAISREVSGLSGEDAATVAALLDRFNLPRHLDPALETPDLLARLSRDKKFRDGQIKFVLLRSLGDAFVSNDVTLAHIESAIEALRK